MDWLAALDLSVFRFLNHTLSNPVFDWLMPFISGNGYSLPLIIGLGIWLLTRGRSRGRCFVVVFALSLWLGDSVIFNPLKKAVARPRPYVTHPETNRRVGAGGDYRSFPSGHSANSACAAAVAILFWRRSWRFMVPLAACVGISRCYNGVHYPSDVLGGWACGAFAGVAGAFLVDVNWKLIGQHWFPLWHARLPSLRSKPLPAGPGNDLATQSHWLRAGYALIGLLLFARICYLGAAVIELSEDEAYQWLWSKHLALSYYSKPPGIALAHWVGTHIFGDTELGSRFLSPVIAAALGVMLLRFVTRHADARTGFLFLLAVTATPLLSVGSILITIDPLLVLCWTAALISGWRAITEDSTRQWVITGLWWGGAFLSKYSSPFLWASFGIFFLLWPPARAQLRRPGPWLALLVNLLCTLPVILWNAQHDWITVHHVSDRGGLSSAWQPTLRFFWDFLYSVPSLLNPFLFIAIVWAAVAFWRDPALRATAGRRLPTGANPPEMLLRYLFCLGAPVFLFYFAYTLRARVQPNWIAPSAVPLLLLAALYWHVHRDSRIGRWLLGLGLGVGLPAVVLLHDTRLISKISGWSLPVSADPLNRVRGYRKLAAAIGEQRAALETADGHPTFIIADHYGRAGLLSYYLPEAKATVGTSRPLVTVRSSDTPENQLWFWPEYHYDQRHGENAIYVLGTDTEAAIPPRLLTEFASVKSLGLFKVEDPGRAAHQVQLFACRGKL